MVMLLSYVAAGILITLGLIWAKGRYMSFAAQSPDDYAFGEEFDIRKVLNGPLACEGIIYGPTGRVTSRFVARFDASWDGNTGVMKEVFNYDSGNVQHREWHLTLEDGGAIKADANDLVGTGRGQQSGNAVLLSYKIKLSDEAGGHVLDAQDWMYLMSNGTVMNRNQFRKFGFKVAELVATMRPMSEAEAREMAA
jgi:glutamine cyclotransferase